MDGNAWELVEEEPKEANRSKSRSPSRSTRVGSEARFEFEGKEIDAEELSNIIDEQVRHECEQRTKRGKLV